jgi:hypothetical protein
MILFIGVGRKGQALSKSVCGFSKNNDEKNREIIDNSLVYQEINKN